VKPEVLDPLEAARPRQDSAASAGRALLLIATFLAVYVLGLLDVALALTLVHLSGGWGSPFYHLAITSLVVPAYLLRPSASALLAGAFVAAYLAVLATAGTGTDGDWAHQGRASLFGHVMTAIMVVGAVQFLAQINRQLVRERDEKEALAALEERARIAREIHDGIAQSIYMLSLNLEKAADLAPSTESGSGLRGLVGLAKASLLEVRQYIFDLKPLLAGESGLVEALRGQVKEFSAVSGVPVEVSVSGSERRLPMEASATMYRIAQEALANAFRHAEASHIGMHISFASDSVSLRVSDDGLGFTNDREGGNGLRNMRQRAERLGGRFRVTSEHGAGTAVDVSLPAKAT
jgi:signal transduction histidine kinase